MINRLFTKPNKQQYFWSWFSKNAASYFYFEQDQNNLFTKLKRELEKVDPNLTFEFSPIFENHTREFIISADGIKSTFPIVQDLVMQAPSIRGWKVIAFRQPHLEVTQINFEKLCVNLKDVYFQYEKDNGKIGLQLYIKDFFESREWTNIIFILLDNILGEFDAEMFLSYIDKKPLNESEKDAFLTIFELPKVIQNFKQEVYN